MLLQKKSDNPSRGRRRISSAVWTAILIAALLVGVALLAYPTVSDLWNRSLATGQIINYIEKIEEMDEDTKDDMWAEAEEWNRYLYEDGTGRLDLTDDEYEQYEQILDVTGTGIMSYLDIPEIDVYLPIYHGTEESVLQIAIGHLEGSSLPVGGDNTHVVVSGHTGLQSAQLLTDLDQLEIGDVFYLHTLGTTLTYEVDQILVVLPDEVDSLAIEEGEDLVTLVTCTPYGVNTHRLLVRGHRIANEVTDVTITSIEDAWEEVRIMGYAVIGFAAAIVVLAAAALILAILIYRQERKARGMLYGDRGGAAQESTGRRTAQAGPLPEEYEYDAPPRTRREEQKYDAPPGGGTAGGRSPSQRGTQETRTASGPAERSGGRREYEGTAGTGAAAGGRPAQRAAEQTRTAPAGSRRETPDDAPRPARGSQKTQPEAANTPHGMADDPVPTGITDTIEDIDDLI